jgi:hypothetical protein
MRVQSSVGSARRGATTAECGVVYSLTLLLLMGTIIAGGGVFRYNQLSTLSREGARWASVHGATYQSELNKQAPTSQDVLTNVVTPMMVGLDSTKLNCTLTMTSNTASVTLTYTWTPEGFFNTPITMTSTSVMPVTY